MQGYPIEEFLRRETSRRRSSETVQLYRSCLYGLRDWMARQGTEMHCRFDVVEVELAPDGSTRSVRWLKDAFRPS